MEGEIEVTHPIRWTVVSQSEVRNVRVVERDGRETNKKHHMPKMNLKTFHI